MLVAMVSVRCRPGRERDDRREDRRRPSRARAHVQPPILIPRNRVSREDAPPKSAPGDISALPTSFLLVSRGRG